MGTNASRVLWVYPARTGHITRCAKGTARTPAPGSEYQRAQEAFLAALYCPSGAVLKAPEGSLSFLSY